jgi:NADH-quinone oxidoreductase subunit E
MKPAGDAQLEVRPETRKLTEILRAFPRERGYLIPILQEIQEQHGYLSKESIMATAEHLDLPSSKIFGVATFYNQFKLVPPGRYRVQICRGTACHVRGSFNLLESLETELGIKAGETARDGVFSLETVACMGACSIAPVVAVNGEFFGRLDRKKLLRIIAEYRAREEETQAPEEEAHA